MRARQMTGTSSAPSQCSGDLMTRARMAKITEVAVSKTNNPRKENWLPAGRWSAAIDCWSFISLPVRQAGQRWQVQLAVPWLVGRRRLVVRLGALGFAAHSLQHVAV